MFIVVVAIVVVGAAFFIWRGLFGPSKEVAEGNAQLEKIAQKMKAKGQDIRKDPMLGPEYLRLHPEEKLPAGEMPNPMSMTPPVRGDVNIGGQPLAPPTPRTPGP